MFPSSVWLLTRASHLDPVRELLPAGQPALVAGAANHRLQLLVAHKAGEERQIHCSQGCGGLVHLQGRGHLEQAVKPHQMAGAACKFTACIAPIHEHI